MSIAPFLDAPGKTLSLSTNSVNKRRDTRSFGFRKRRFQFRSYKKYWIA